MVFGVAMNSKKKTLMGLLVAANFAEIKGTVFKRFDGTKLYNLVCQDIVERFHLLLQLGFVLSEEAGGSGILVPSAALFAQCAAVFASELAIDVIKHAVVGKFNDVRPGVYREFMREVAERAVAARSAEAHRLVGLEPYGAAALFLRCAATYVGLVAARAPLRPGAGWVARAACFAVLWAGLLLAKIAVGTGLRAVAGAFVRHYDARVVTKGRHVLRRPQASAARKEGARS